MCPLGEWLGTKKTAQSKIEIAKSNPKFGDFSLEWNPLLIKCFRLPEKAQHKKSRAKKRQRLEKVELERLPSEFKQCLARRSQNTHDMLDVRLSPAPSIAGFLNQLALWRENQNRREPANPIFFS